MTFDEWKKSNQVTVQRVTVEEIEQDNMYEDDGRVPHVPFGFGNAAWLTVKSQLREGDELYSYCSSPESWEHLAGRMGYVLIRQGEILEKLPTLMN